VGRPVGLGEPLLVTRLSLFSFTARELRQDLAVTFFIA
jgi:hypothetical protein